MPTTVQEYGMLNSGAWGDRIVSQTFWMNLLNNMLQNGVVVEDGTEAQLSATTPAGMSCKISNFDAAIEGVFYTYEEDEIELTFDAPDAQPRYDLIVLKLDRLVDHDVEVYVLKGTPAAAPEYPALTRTDDGIYELALWAIPVDPGDVVLDIGNAISLIEDTDYCGLFDLNYRAVAGGTLIPYATDYTYYDPAYYNMDTPGAASWADCPKWLCKDDDYIVGVAHGIYLFVHDRAADTTVYKNPTHATYTLSLQSTGINRPIIVDGKVFIPNGKINLDATYKRLLIYDIAGDTITYSAQIPTTNTSPFSLNVRMVEYDGDIYAIGNKTPSYDGYIYKYDIAADTWTLVDTLTMAYDNVSWGGTTNYTTFVAAADQTTGLIYLYAYSGTWFSTYTFAISTKTLTRHVGRVGSPINNLGDYLNPGTNPSVYYQDGIMYITCGSKGFYGYSFDTNTWAPTLRSTYGVGAINILTGHQSAGPIYSLANNSPLGYDRIFLDSSDILGLSYLTNSPTTVYQNKMVYFNPMPILGSSDRTLLCQLRRSSTNITFKNFTTGQGYLGGRDAVPIKASDQYGCTVYDKTLAETSTWDDVITFNLEVIGAN